MPKKKEKQLSRRDALKVLGAAAGATALANLPKKWNSPELLSGILPAHAQTSTVPTETPVTPTETPVTPTETPVVCTDWALYTEVLSGNFIFNLLDGPIWDLHTGSGEPGSSLGWECQTGCLYAYLHLNTILSSSGSIRIETMAGEIIENYTDTDPARDVVVDLGTGAISIQPGGTGGTAGSCTYTGFVDDEVQPDAPLYLTPWH